MSPLSESRQISFATIPMETEITLEVVAQAISISASHNNTVSPIKLTNLVDILQFAVHKNTSLADEMHLMSLIQRLAITFSDALIQGVSAKDVLVTFSMNQKLMRANSLIKLIVSKMVVLQSDSIQRKM